MRGSIVLLFSYRGHSFTSKYCFTFMEKKLYVGGVSYDSSDESLKTAFEAAGTVESANIITDKMTGRSRGFAFVEMSTPEEAQKAIDMFDGQEVDGRRVKVSEAQPKKEF